MPPAKVTGDYSQYPASIRDVIPYVEGEVIGLRNCWQVYHALFMDDERKTAFFGERFGPMLVFFQNLLGKEMILSIARLTDKDSKNQRNLSLWALTEASQFAKDKDFSLMVQKSLDRIDAAVQNIRKRRHKDIAHLDLAVSIGKAPLPEVLLKELKSSLEQMEEFLSLFHTEFAKTHVDFASLSSEMIIASAFETAVKAKVYDELEAESIISPQTWERRAEKWPWWRWH